MVPLRLKVGGTACLAVLTVLVSRTPSVAISLDKDGDIKLGVRTYVNARIGTESTDKLDTVEAESKTFPYSPGGHLRQNRAFIQAEYDHDLSRLIKNEVGP